MLTATHELRTRAEILHRKIQAGDRHALARLRVLPDYRKASYETLEAAPASIRRADCLTLIAAELGFANWPEAKRALENATPGDNFGTLLCPPHNEHHLNLWYKTHEEAAEVRAARGGYLLAYRRQFFVADWLYVEEALGLDSRDPDWEAIGFDWARPKSAAARTRLYAKLVTQRSAR